jgi:hypothetical protein
MTPPRFFTDEDVYGAIAPALRAAGIDAVSTPEAGRLGELDESQLAWATSEGRVLVTFNVGHFIAHHTNWLQLGKHHSGIVVSAQRPIGDLLRRLLHLVAKCEAVAMRDRLEFLSDW